jgi:hypothetical protein
MNVPPPQPLQANYRIANVSAVASAMMLIGCFFDFVLTVIGITTLLALAYLRWRRRWMRVLLFCLSLCNLMLWLVALGGLDYIFGTVDRNHWEAAVVDEPRPITCYMQRYGECSGFDIPCSMAGATTFTGPHAQCSASCGVDNDFPTTCKERMDTIEARLCGLVLLFLASSVLILLATTWLSSTNAPRTGKSGGWLFWLLALTCILWHLHADPMRCLPLAGAGLLLAHTRSRKLKYAFLALTSVYIAREVNVALETKVAQRSGHIPADTMLFDLTKTNSGPGAMPYDLWKFIVRSPEEQLQSGLCEFQDLFECSGYSKPCTSQDAWDDLQCSDSCSKSNDNPSPCRDQIMLGLLELDQKRNYASIAFAVGASLIALFFSCT